MMHPYATDVYARSLSHLGDAMRIPEWGCSVVLRDLGGGLRDAFSTYPIAIMAENADIAGGLERLRQMGLVAVTLVLDDFHRPSLRELQANFDVITPFKTHWIRRNGLPFSYGKNHRYNLARALKKVTVEPFDLKNYHSEWTSLYQNLTQRHGIAGGVQAFSSGHVQALARLEGVLAIGAWLEGRLVSAQIWVSDGRYAHSHLTASSDEGYDVRAAYAVNHAAVDCFPAVELMNFGGGAGLEDDPSDGLVQFKKGFCNDSSQAYICGAILDRIIYKTLSEQRGVPPATTFFPAYGAAKSA
jgi:hypothetical protein